MDENQTKGTFSDSIIKYCVDKFVDFFAKHWLKVLILIVLLAMENNRRFLGFAVEYITGSIKVETSDVATLLQVMPIVIVSYLGYRINQKMYEETEKRKLMNGRIKRVQLEHISLEYLNKKSLLLILWKYRLEEASKETFEKEKLKIYYQSYLTEVKEFTKLVEKRQEKELELLEIFGDQKLFKILRMFLMDEKIFLEDINSNANTCNVFLENDSEIYKAYVLKDIEEAFDRMSKSEDYSQVLKNFRKESMK